MTNAELPDERAAVDVTSTDETRAGEISDSPEYTDPSNRETDDEGSIQEPGEATFEPPAIYRPLAFIEVTLDLPDQFPTVVLQEFDAPYRRIVIPIGMAEGNAIAFAAKQLPTSKPLTHALMISILEEFGLEVLTLRITDVDHDNFSGELVFSGPSGQKTLPCRVSDGIALCLRQRPPVPITALLSVIDQAGSPA